MRAYVEITFIPPCYSRACGCNVPGGFEANCSNPDDFDCTQIYSQRTDTKAQAYEDIREQLRALGATCIVTGKLEETFA